MKARQGVTAAGWVYVPELINLQPSVRCSLSLSLSRSQFSLLLGFSLSLQPLYIRARAQLSLSKFHYPLSVPHPRATAAAASRARLQLTARASFHPPQHSLTASNTSRERHANFHRITMQSARPTIYTSFSLAFSRSLHRTC